MKARTVERAELTGDDMAAFFRAVVDPKGTMLTTDAIPLYHKADKSEYFSSLRRGSPE